MAKLKKANKSHKITDDKIKKYNYIIEFNKALIKLDDSNIIAEKKAKQFEKEYKLLSKNECNDSLLINNEKLNGLLKEVHDSYNETIKAKKEYDLLKNI